MVRPRHGVALIAVVVGTVVAGCGHHSPTSGQPAAPAATGTVATTATRTVATATTPSVAVYARPDADQPALTLSNPNEDGAPRVLLVVDTQPGWLHVLLPVRPNGSTGWVRADSVTQTATDYHVDVALAAHRIVVHQGDTVVDDEPIAVGTADAPTPGGQYYLTELLQPSNPAGPYGPYAFGLSGYSNVLGSFAGGPGALGLHGTNQPALLGRDVSHGCIRMSNAGITKLAHLLPVGTPVTINS